MEEMARMPHRGQARDGHAMASKAICPTLDAAFKTKGTGAVGDGQRTLLQSLTEARHLMEMFRRQVSTEETKPKLARLINRLDKISAEISKFDTAEK